MLLAPKDFFVERGGGADEMVNAFRMIKGQGHVFAIKVSALKLPQNPEKNTHFSISHWYGF